MIRHPLSQRRELISEETFSVSARVALQLGRESISNSVTAISELVKNAYDADAEIIRIRFLTVRSHRILVIEDNGDGMTATGLRERWMVIGTSNKVADRRTGGKQRVKTGEKGLGRLGLDRLCTHTRVQTAVADAPDSVELKVNWQKYETFNARLENIAHRLYSIPGLANSSIPQLNTDLTKGTRLILLGLKDRWDEDQVRVLHQELSFLLSPFGSTDDFSIELDTGGIVPALDGVIEPLQELLNDAYWEVVSTIDLSGNVEIVMEANGRTQQYRQSSTPWGEFVKGYGSNPHCGPLTFRLYFFRRDDDEEQDARFTRAEIGTFLKNNQGVRVYRDGFRVKPYGEPNGEGDWLRLAYQRMANPKGVKQKGAWRVGYNQVVGAIFLSRDGNPNLLDQTNREGLVLGDAFTHLVAFAQKSVRFFEHQHQTFEREINRHDSNSATDGDSGDAERASKDAAGALARLSKIAKESTQTSKLDPPLTSTELPSGNNDPTTLVQLTDTLSTAVTELEATIRQKNAVILQQEKDKNTMANLASLGILAASFGHETLGWANLVLGNATLLKHHVESGLFMAQPDLEAKVKREIAIISSESRKLETFAAFALGNVAPAKRKRREVFLKDVAKDVLKIFEKTFQADKNVTADFVRQPVGSCTVWAYRIDWESIFINLIVNAVWAMRTTAPEHRKIRLQMIEEETLIRIIFEDSGHGLEANTDEQIFEAGYSTKRNAGGEQEGTGMGLFIVKSFVVENSKGRIAVLPKGELGGATFTIEVPRYKKDN